MAQGQVSVNNLNLGQGPVAAIERHFLFIGPATKNAGKLLALNTQSDLDTELGVATSDLKTQITAARTNGGDRWACAAVPLAADGDWKAALDQAQSAGISVEAVVITKPVTASTDIQAMHTAAVNLISRYGRRVFVLAASAGISPALDWSAYRDEQRALIHDLAAPRVGIVPQLHGNDLGVLAGRLANAAVSIADSPMRVATGALVGLGPTPVDKDSERLSSATLAELDKMRFSVPQNYPDYPGMFWGDANLLDAAGSDFAEVETCASSTRPLAVCGSCSSRWSPTARSTAPPTAWPTRASG